MKKNKNVVALIILIILLMILGLLSFIFFNNLKEEDKNYVSTFTQMGSEIYSNYYYKIISSNKTKEVTSQYLKKYETLGLKFDLVQLSKYSDEFKDTIDNFIKENEKCKKEDVIITIFPKDPYGSNDYTSELKLDCINENN